jgi:thiol-disulfide isomerase/thioredoxin
MKASRGLALFGLAVLAAGLGYLIQRGLQKGAAPALTPVVQAPTDAAATDAADEPAPEKKALPETLPQFELKDREGTVRTLGHWKGRPLVVNYWATWCPPCVREIPLLSRLRQDHKAQSLEVIGIAVDFRDDVLAFAARKNLDYPLLIGEEDGLAAVTAVGMEPTFPFTIFADSQQRIVALKVGELHEDEATLIIDRVAKVDGGTLDLPAAREQISEGLKDLATRRATAAAGAAGAKAAP